MARPFLLHQLLLESAERTPDAVALIDPKRAFSYSELAHEAAKVASALRAAKVRPGELVGLWSEKTSAAVAAVYGILQCAAAYVPVDPAVPRARAALVLANVGARVVVAPPDRVELLAEMKAAGELPTLAIVVALGPLRAGVGGLGSLEVIDATAADAGRTQNDARSTDGSLAYVLHTSGSTGVPKGVAISHRNALAFVEPASERFALTASDRLGCHAPLHFDLSVFDLFCAANVGAAVVLFPEYFSAFPKKMSQAIDEHRITVWNSVVSALALLLDKGLPAQADSGPTLASLRAVLFSGERMPLALLRRLRVRLPSAELFNVYGQTEANSSMVYAVGEIPSGDGGLPLGEPLPNFQVFLLSDDQTVARGNETSGELCVRAATVASGGYFRDPERTGEKFILDPELPESGAFVYRTGDLARRSRDGQLFLVGRRDNMVKTRGYRVELGEIEMAIEAVPGAGEVAVVAVPSEAIGHALVAFIEPSAPLEPSDVEAALRKRLPAYMVPQRIVVRLGLPRTSTGKIDRKQLAVEAQALALDG